MSDGRASIMGASMAGMIASMKASKKKKDASGTMSTNTGLGSTAATTPSSASAAAAAAKPKKLSEKGKAKLALHRGKERVESELHRLEQEYAEAHPELIDANGEMEMPGIDDLFNDGLTTDTRLEAFVKEERKQIENEEMVRKLAKLQRKHNTMQNALLKGNKVATGYDRDEIDLRVVQKELKKTREKERLAIIVLDEPIPLIRNATNAAAVGYKSLVTYLEQEAILREFNLTDMRYLRASLDAELEKRNSPINFRVEILWRFACVLQEFKKGDREQNLRLALHIYEKLIERCDPELHPFQYAGLQNTLELCDIELERVVGYKLINRANRDFEFAEINDPATNFNFERKHKEEMHEDEKGEKKKSDKKKSDKKKKK